MNDLGIEMKDNDSDGGRPTSARRGPRGNVPSSSSSKPRKELVHAQEAELQAAAIRQIKTTLCAFNMRSRRSRFYFGSNLFVNRNPLGRTVSGNL